MRKTIFAVVIAAAAVCFSGCAKKNEVSKTPEELYRDAVTDAAFADEDEILPLVSLVESDQMTTWKDGKVLLLTWHNYPDSYPAGETVTIQWGPVWTFTDKEIASHSEELRKTSDPETRLKQLISFAPDSEHSTVTGFWVDPRNVKRPAYQSDPTNGNMITNFGESVDEEYKKWFDDNILWSYYYGEYPWTRLGYTYDWADNGTEYGMTEFIVESGAEVKVEFTETTDEFLNRITKS
ncbi:MAG: hypothetical protein K2N06_12960 [Oscillospiraceae bacterium]|nr:hypothetical protein [Oscillospiraceae bacterium]